ncbi:DUF6602 domain-containing protein [Curtobacterium sp. SL109]|uniref:DUF6602 domain-containing protein n=1 Tax=Curtobacterium sp. SL109 TaxID=2994662 RepID=UPI002275F614|nr:DUF6602 domain-containing protein [Curtobacterium sp. SL109]MCY1692945.1 hypothetical protein [Curtobacterium sp. SL109]
MPEIRREDGVVREKLSAIFRAEEQRLASSLSQARAGLQHRPSKGQQVEVAVRDFILGHLPRRFDVGSGEVFDRWGAVSDQLDIVISNDDQPFRHGPDQAGFYLAEGVSAIGEVKSRLTRTELRDIAKKGRSVRRLEPAPLQMNEPLSSNISDASRFVESFPTFAIALETSMTLATINEALNAEVPVPAGAPARGNLGLLDALFVLGRGYFVYLADGQGALRMLNPETGETFEGWAYMGPETLLGLFTWLDAVVARRYRWQGVATPYILRSISTDGM